MTRTPIFLAAGEMDAALASWRLTDPAMRERLLIFGAMGAVSLLVVLWAIFLRRKRKRRRKHHHSSSPASAPELRQVPMATPEPEKHHRHRRSRRRHRPRNPTLAETGGLPPIRPDEPLEPSL
jgi:type VI protein secretion system component VasK